MHNRSRPDRCQPSESYSWTGRPSIDAEVLLRLLRVGYLYGITSKRRLLEEVRMHLAYRWFTRLDFGQEIPDHPCDPLDDVADDARYGPYTFINASEKPRELRIREALKPLAEIQDMTSAYVRWKQVTDEPRYRPATFGRYSRRRW